MASSLRFTSRLLPVVTGIIILVWLAGQIILVTEAYGSVPVSDSLRYVTLAQQAYEAGSWYPMPSQTTGLPDNPSYICYPGLINMFVLCLRLFGSYRPMMIANIIFNCVIAAGIYLIIKRLSGKTSGYFAVIMYCLCPLTLIYTTQYMSEIPCMAVIMVSILFCGHRKWWTLVIAGICLAFAQYIRTVALLYAAGVIVYMIVKRYGVRDIAIYAVSIGIGFIMVGEINRAVSGRFFISSTTLGINMLIGANDDCEGGYNSAVLSDELDNELIGLDAFGCDSAYRTHAMEWIKEHPGKWALLSVKKIRYQIGTEHPAWLPDALNYGLHFIFLCLVLAGIIIKGRDLTGVSEAVLLPLIGSVALAVLTVGHPRYNYPFMPCLVYFASAACLRLLKCKGIGNFSRKFAGRDS